MYLADELPVEDRAEVERRLAGDAGLQAEFERLREAQDAFTSAMRLLDAGSRLPVPERVGVRRVAGAIRQWQADRMTRAEAPAPKAALRYPWWAYPVAAAASVVIAFVVWWGNSSERPDSRYAVRNLPLHFDTDERPSVPDMMAAMILATSGPVDPPEEFASLVEPSDDAVLLPLMDEVGGGAGQPDQPESDTEREDDDWYFLL